MAKIYILSLIGASVLIPLTAGWSQTGQINQSYSATGTYPTGTNLNLSNVPSDNAEISDGTFLNAYTFQHTINSTRVYGGRQAVFSLMQFQSPTSPSNPNRNYASAAFRIDVSAADNGSNTSNGAAGAFFAINPVAVASAGATNLLELTGGEVNWAAQTGSSMRNKAGLSLVALGSDQISGSETDSMLLLGAQAGAVGANVGILVGTANGQYPLKRTATLIDAGPGTMAIGADFSHTTVSTAVIKMSGGQKIDLGGGASIGYSGVAVGGVVAGAIVRTYAVAFVGLPTADPSPVRGDRAYITDAASCSFNLPVAGGGTVSCPVVFDGSVWVAG